MDALENWHEYNVAMLGATAALAGLVIVAASVNIQVVITAASLTSRVASGIAGLILASIVCAVFVTPLLYAAGGIIALTGSGGGLVWLAVGAIAAIVSALFVSWVVLVEVLR